MLDKLMDRSFYQYIMYLMFSIVVASCIIVLIITFVGTSNANSLYALEGGYSGILVGMIFVAIFNSILIFKTGLNLVNFLKMTPFIAIIIISAMMISFLALHFDKIYMGRVSEYYDTFSTVSVLCLILQIGILFNDLFNSEAMKNGQTNNILSNSTLALLTLISVINGISLITLGVVLTYYSI